MFNFNKSTINGDNATVYQNIDNSRTTIYLQTGRPEDASISEDVSSAERDPYSVRVANWLTDLPTIITNFFSDDSNPDEKSSLVIFVIVVLVSFAFTIALSKLLLWIVIILAVFSLFHYLYLHLYKSVEVNYNFYLQQIIILIAMYIFNSSITVDMQIYNQHTLTNISNLLNPNMLFNNIGTNFSFWLDKTTTLFSFTNRPTPEAAMTLSSSLLTALISTSSIYFYLIKSLRLLALKSKVTFLSTIGSILACCVIVVLLVKTPELAAWFSQHFFSQA